MPRFDGAGPFGTGPVGRGMGPCGAGRRGGFGYGRGFWGGGNRPRWGWGARGGGFGAPQWGGGSAQPQDEVQFLKQQAADLQNELDAVQRRLNELESA